MRMKNRASAVAALCLFGAGLITATQAWGRAGIWIYAGGIAAAFGGIFALAYLTARRSGRRSTEDAVEFAAGWGPTRGGRLVLAPAGVRFEQRGKILWSVHWPAVDAVTISHPFPLRWFGDVVFTSEPGTTGPFSVSDVPRLRRALAELGRADRLHEDP
jgi:hypothetical protein